LIHHLGVDLGSSDFEPKHMLVINRLELMTFYTDVESARRFLRGKRKKQIPFELPNEMVMEAVVKAAEKVMRTLPDPAEIERNLQKHRDSLERLRQVLQREREQLPKWLMSVWY